MFTSKKTVAKQQSMRIGVFVRESKIREKRLMNGEEHNYELIVSPKPKDEVEKNHLHAWVTSQLVLWFGKLPSLFTNSIAFDVGARQDQKQIRLGT
jgi:hypothetical protein